MTDESGQDDSDEGETADEAYTITGINYTWSEPPISNGEGIKLINERFNVDYQPQFVPESDYNEKLSAVMASGDLPDMIGFRSQGPTQLNFYKWAEQGAFLPLDDYVDDLPTWELVPDFVKEAMVVDGKIYGLPTYYSLANLSPIIRKDWLDNLGLDIPTNYEELKEVALAFTHDDPDGNGKDDTYGMVMSEGIKPDFSLGAYWSDVWYHKNDEGQYIPGLISDARKELIEFLHDLYQEGAITREFTLLTWDDSNNEFYSGKGGIYAGAATGISEALVESLVEIDPDAELVAIPPFEAPDGTKGFESSVGHLGMVALSAELEGQPEKVEKILELLEVGKTFIPWDERTPDNELFDWMKGHEGQGYEMQDGEAVDIEGEGLRPESYFFDKYKWVADDAENEHWRKYDIEQLINLSKELSDMHENMEHYGSPHFGIISDTQTQKGDELNTFLLNEQTKMIAGERPLSEWEDMVEEYLNDGGQQIIDEINEQIEVAGREGVWE